jgi:tetratricopeptide (TPR) repeat protein
MSGLAQALALAGRRDQAAVMLEQVLAGARHQLGEDHPNTLLTMGNLARVYRESRQFEKALSLSQRTLDLKRVKLGEDHPDTLNELAALAVVFDQAGQLDRAMPLYEQVLQLRRAKLGNDHPNTLLSMNGLAQARRKNGELAKAEVLLRESLDARRRTAPDEWHTFYTHVLLGATLLNLERYDEAEPFLLAGYEGLRRQFDRIPPPERHCLNNAVQSLVMLYEKSGRPDRAEDWRAVKLQGRQLTAAAAGATAPASAPNASHLRP